MLPSETTTVLRVYLDDGDSILADLAEKDRIDATMTDYLSSNSTRDKVIDISCGPSTIYIPVSKIVCWTVETPETRKFVMGLHSRLEAEQRTIKQELGMWDND